jgi:thiol reductant ABC exporter CydC subunit
VKNKGVLVRALGEEQAPIRHAVLAGLLVSLSTIGLSGTSAWLIVRAAQEPAILSLTVPMGLVQLFALAKAAGRYLERTQTHRAALGVMGHVRASVARLLEPLVPAGLGPRSSDVVDVVVRDVDRVQDLLTAVAGPLLTSAVAGVVTVAITAAIVPLSALSLLVALVLTAVVLPWAAARLGYRSEAEIDAVRAGMVGLFDRVSQGGDEYVMAGAAESLGEELAELERRYDRANFRRTLLMGVISGLTTLVSGLCVVTTVLVSALGLRSGHLAPALLAVPALLSVTVLELVGGVAPMLVGLRGDRAALARLEALADVGAPVTEPDVGGLFDTASASLRASNVGATFADTVALRDVSFELRRGDVVALSGPSGGGKTTFARLLAKFLDPREGVLQVGGADYATLRSEQVRQVVGFVDDAPHVFATTLAGNLRIANPHASDDELVVALDGAGLRALLASMPEGLDTKLGGATTGLSGGEQRRLGVARELLVRRPIIIFDEPTEGLDEETASLVMDRIVAAFGEGAVLVISHRDADYVHATRRAVIANGQLRELVVTGVS